MTRILNAYAVPSLLILLLAVLRACLGSKIPRKFFYILWTAAALRFLMPFTLGLPLLPYEMPVEMPVGAAAFSQTFPAGEASRECAVYESSGTFGANHFNENIFTLIYIIGAAAIALYFCIGHIKTINRCKISLPSEAGTDGMKIALDMRRNVDIRTCENAVSPFTYGIFHPVIILPRGVTGERLRHITGHELVHIKRMDVLRKLLLAIALCIHWTNPAVWLLYALAERDMEITCDEEAVKLFAFSPKSYALTIIDMEERLLPSALTAFGKKPVRERIERLAQFGKTPSVMGAAAGFGAVMIIAAFFTAVEHMPPRVVYVNVSDTYDASYAAEAYTAAETYAAEETADAPPTITSVNTVTLPDGVTLYEIETSDLSEDGLWELEAAANNAFDATLTSVWNGITYIFDSDNAASVMVEAAPETVYYSDEYMIAVSADNTADSIYTGGLAGEVAGDFAGEIAIAVSDDTVTEDIK